MAEDTTKTPLQRGLTRRDLLRASGVVASGGLLAACFPGASTSTPTAAPSASKVPSGVVTFWHVWGGERKPIMDKMIANFQAQMPSITIQDTVLPSQGLQEKYLTAIAGGTAPEVLMMTTQNMPAFASKGALRGVDDLIQRDKILPKTEIYPGNVDMATYQGKLYGLPGVAAGPFYMLFWNKAHFREVGLDPDKGPATWDEFNAYVKRLTKRSGSDIQRIGALYWRVQGELRQWIHSNAGGLYSADGRQVQFNRKENIETLEWMVSSLKEQYGGYEKIRAFATDSIGGSSAEGNRSFYTGGLSIHMTGVWMFLLLQNEAPNIEYGVGPAPYNAKNPAAKPVQFAEGLYHYVITKDAKNVDASWEWIKYITFGEGQRFFFKEQGRPTVVAKYNEDPDYQKSNKFWPIVKQGFDQMVTDPVTEVFGEDLAIFIKYTEEAILEKRSPADALNTATAEAQKVHDAKLR